MNLPWFRFYGEAYLGSPAVATFSLEQEFWYLRFIVWSSQNTPRGTLPSDLRKLWLLVQKPYADEQTSLRCQRFEFFCDHVKPVLAKFILEADRGIYVVPKTASQVDQDPEAISAARRQAGTKGAAARWNGKDGKNGKPDGNCHEVAIEKSTELLWQTDSKPMADRDLDRDIDLKSKPAAARASSDPRYQPLVDSFFKHFPKFNQGKKPTWGDLEGRNAKLLLADAKPDDWDSDALDRCVEFRMLSRNKPASERPGVYLTHLTKYFEAPLDEFGKPDYVLLRKWEGRIASQAEPPDAKPMPKPKAPAAPPSDAAKAYLASHPDPWGDVKDYLAPRVSRHSYDTWIKPTKFDHVESSVLVVAVPTPEFRHIGEKYGSLIQEAITGAAMPFDDVMFKAWGA